MKAVYPAFFYYDIETEGYSILFPDFINAATMGESLVDAMEMASEYLGILLADRIESKSEIPSPSDINKLSLIEDNPFKEDKEINNTIDFDKAFISLVVTDVSQFLGMDEPVKKTLTIPKWADTLGKEMNLNFSETLTEAIGNKKLGW